jgi:hypothetical protein
MTESASVAWGAARVATFDNCHTIEPTSHPTINDVLLAVRNPTPEHADLIARVRAAATKDERDRWKGQLPAISFAADLHHRRGGTPLEDKILAWSGVAAMDLDGLENPAGTRDSLRGDSFVAAAFVSPSGTGVKVIVRLAEAERFSDCWRGAAQYFQTCHGLVVDPAPKHPTSLCYLSADPEIYIAEGEVEAFQPMATEVAPIGGRLPNESGPLRPGDDFNNRADIAALLVHHGWSLARDGENQHWRRPGKVAGVSATLKNGVLYVFSSNAAPFEANRAYRSFAVYALLEHGGNFEQAARQLRQDGYGKAETAVAIEVTSQASAADEPTPLLPSALFAYQTADDPNTLLGQRWLCRSGSCLIVGQTGIGKSSFCVQAAVSWALGEPVFGIHPKRPLKSLIIQAENDTGDLAEMFRGVLIGTDRCERLPELDHNIRFVSETSKSGMTFMPYVRELIAAHKPDLVWIDPLFSFLGGNASDQEVVSTFLRNGLGAIAQETKVTWMIVHHTNKPAKDGKVASVGSDYAYIGAGSAELANWARAVLVLREIGDDTYELRAAKRGRRAGLIDLAGNATTEVCLKHGTAGICWQRSIEAQDHADEDDIAQAEEVIAVMERQRQYSRMDVCRLVKKVMGARRASVMTAGRPANRIYRIVLERTSMPNNPKGHMVT